MDDDQVMGSEAELRDRARHLDFSNLLTIAEYIAQVVASGVAGNIAYEWLKGLHSRFGARKLSEIEDLVLKELQKAQRKKSLSNEDLRLRAQELIRKIREG